MDDVVRIVIRKWQRENFAPKMFYKLFKLKKTSDIDTDISLNFIYGFDLCLRKLKKKDLATIYILVNTYMNQSNRIMLDHRTQLRVGIVQSKRTFYEYCAT